MDEGPNLVELAQRLQVHETGNPLANQFKDNVENPKWNQEIEFEKLSLEDIITFRLLTTNTELNNIEENEETEDGPRHYHDGLVIGETTIKVRDLIRRPVIHLALTQPRSRWRG
jgi:hypothetical protein